MNQNPIALKAVLFDLEGTLVETVYERDPDAVDRERRTVRNMIVDMGIPEEALEGFVKQTLVRNRALDWAESNMSHEEFSRFSEELDSFMRPIEMRSAKLTRLYPDTREALIDLKSRGARMGLVTNTSRDATDHMLRTLGLVDFFPVVVTRNDARRLKPDPEIVLNARAKMRGDVGWLVGDTIFDADAAKSANLKSIIIQRGGIRPEFSHDFFVSSLTEISSIIISNVDL